MKRRMITVMLAILLLAAMVAAPVSASAATKVKILKVTADGARLRSGPSSAYSVVTSVGKGSKVLYLNKTKNSFARVRTVNGRTGYMYKGFLKSYGTCYKNQIYYTTKAAQVYKKASTSSKKVTKLSKKQHVILYQVKGNWAYIKTLGGTGGYMKKSTLRKAF